MIKLQRIKDLRYFKFQKWLALFNIPCLLTLALMNFFEWPLWLEIGILSSVLVYFIFAIVGYYKFYSLNKRQYIEINGDTVRLTNQKGKVYESGELLEIDQLNMEFDIDTIKQYQKIWKVLNGEYVCSSMRIKTENGIKQLYFWVDSYYHLKKLKRLCPITVKDS